MREVEGQLETQTAFAAASAKVSAAMRDACSQSEILIAQMKQNQISSASREATAHKRIAELEAQMSGYESYFSQTRQLQSGGSTLFGIGLFIVSLSVSTGGFSTPRSSPLTPGKKGSARGGGWGVMGPFLEAARVRVKLRFACACENAFCVCV